MIEGCSLRLLEYMSSCITFDRCHSEAVIPNTNGEGVTIIYGKRIRCKPISSCKLWKLQSESLDQHPRGEVQLTLDTEILKNTYNISEFLTAK